MEDKAIYKKQPSPKLYAGSSALKGGGVIGIDFGATQLRAAIVTEHGLGQIISNPTPNQGTAEDVWEAISGLIQMAIKQNKGNTPAAICVGVPSVVDTVTGTVYNVQHIPACKELPLGRLIAEKYGTLALINNDANAFALGEYYFGETAKRLPATEFNAKSMQSGPSSPETHVHQPKQYSLGKSTNSQKPSSSVPSSSLVGLTIGTGLGAGLILDGKLFSGPNCGAGEIGCLPYLDANLERYVSGAFFNKDGITGKEYYHQAMAGDKKALDLYRAFGHHLGQAIKITMYAYDPDRIVLGGSVSLAYDLFKEEMIRSMQNFNYPGILEKIKVYPSTLENGAILGAASLYYDYVRHAIV